MPAQTPSASDYTKTVAGSAQVNAAVASTSSGVPIKRSLGSVPLAGGALSAVRSAVTQSRVAQTSGLQPLTVRAATAAAPVVLPAWSPTQLGKPMYVWLDASDPLNTGSEPANDTEILSWKDKSGNGRDAAGQRRMPSITIYPKFKSKALNGGTKQAIETRSDGNAVIHAWFDITTSENQFSNNLVWFVVYEGYRTSANNAVITRSITGGTRCIDQYTATRLPPGSAFLSTVWDHTKTASDTPPGPVNNASVLFQSLTTPGGNGTTTTFLEIINGSSTFTTTSPNQTDAGQTKITLGSRGDMGTSSDLYISEVIVFNVGITTDERQKIEGYLAWKWDLVSKLPANHPYKSARPT